MPDERLPRGEKSGTKALIKRFAIRIFWRCIHGPCMLTSVCQTAAPADFPGVIAAFLAALAMQLVRAFADRTAKAKFEANRAGTLKPCRTLSHMLPGSC